MEGEQAGKDGAEVEIISSGEADVHQRNVAMAIRFDNGPVGKSRQFLRKEAWVSCVIQYVWKKKSSRSTGFIMSRWQIHNNCTELPAIASATLSDKLGPLSGTRRLPTALRCTKKETRERNKVPKRDQNCNPLYFYSGGVIRLKDGRLR